MLERDLVHIFVGSLQRDFPNSVVMKNHGDQYQQHGRPDIEASIYGRHCVFELKAGSQPTAIQQTMISRYSKAGSVTGLIVWHEHSQGIYFVHANLCKEFSYRKCTTEYLKIGHFDQSQNKHICSTRFLWAWVSEAYIFYIRPEEVFNIFGGANSHHQ